MVFHPVIDLLASASEDASIKLWDSESGEVEKTLKGHTQKVNAIAINRQGNILASCSKDLSVKLWDLEKYE